MTPTMTSILNRFLGPSLFESEDGPRSAWQVIGWWEVRRVAFNLVVGIAGILTIATGALALGTANAFLQTPLHRPDPPLFFFVLVYAVLANLCYTGGWVAELACRRLWPATRGDLAAVSFRLGLLFSILVTLLPAFLAVAFAVHAILTHNPLIAP